MTPNELIDKLKLPQDKIDRIHALSGSLAHLENVLHEHEAEGAGHGADSPMRQGIRTEAQQGVDLVSQLTGEDKGKVQSALLGMFGVSEKQFDDSCTVAAKLVAFKNLVAREND